MMTETELEIRFIKACANVVQNNVLERVLERNFAELGVPEYTEEERTFAKAIFDGIAPSERSSDLDQYSAPEARRAERPRNASASARSPTRCSPTERATSSSPDRPTWAT